MSETIDFGIDLGTTSSSVAVCRNGEVKVFQTTEQMNVTPSVVYVSRTGRMLVGRRAYDAWAADPENTQAEFKRWMGFSDTLSLPASGKKMSAEELSAEVLKSLRADVERETEESITAAVITVPAAFGSLQCDATARAASLAGFEQAPLLQEPIAAAVAYGATPDRRDQRWMIFDLGGGTLDIAIVSTRDGAGVVPVQLAYERASGTDVSPVAVKWVRSAFRTLHWNVVMDQSWYWEDRLDALKSPGRRFLNRERAEKLLTEGDAAQSRGDVPAMRTAVSSLWELIPPDRAEAARDQEAASGLRGR